MSMSKRDINLCAVFAAIGLTVNITWCTLVGHTSGFAEALSGFGTPVNPRAFFLLGILLTSAAFVAVPHQLREREAFLWPIMALLSSFGTMTFAMAADQTTFSPTMLSIAGLIVFGMGYFWLTACFVLLAARTQTFACVAVCVAVSLIVEPVLVSQAEAFLSPAAQVTLVTVMPIVSAALFQGARHAALAQRSVDSAQDGAMAFGVPLKPRTSLGCAGRRNVMTLVVAASLLLATVRSLSFVGLWGDGHIASAQEWPTMTSSPVLWAGYAIVLALFTYFAIVKMENLPPHLRFQPPLLIVILTLFVSLLLSAEPDASPAVIDTLMRLNDSFSHLLFWVLVATLLNVTHIPSYRAIGSASGLYAVGSIIWVLFLSNTTAMGNLIVVVVIYAFSLVAMLLGLGRRDKGTPRDAAAQPESESRQATGGSPAALMTRAIEDRCAEVSDTYGLSPRETEILNLLVQGRTRAYIQEDLVLAENTVKTHVAHIYGKLGVKDRKEMVDLIFDAQAEDEL